MSETTQEFRDAFRRQIDKDGDADIYPGELIALFNDADRLARLEDGIRALADEWETSEDLALSTYAGQAVEKCANQLRALLEE